VYREESLFREGSALIIRRAAGFSSEILLPWRMLVKLRPHGDFLPVNFRRGDFLAFPVITGASVTTQLFLFAQSLVLQCVLRRKTGWHTTGRQVIFTGRTANSN